ncbi:alkylated DNA repair protein alkB homolog 7 [Clonorchis sinensis]|uniref:Alkylated DNA repair protein alkB homolog 7 n=1 Tax=Clonorchis sinensis TaxID=79923 RepID=G7Y752_CLOSI|nr:alkylated DNA repair protein alkB homolog 7 [Clonorchis sinensis]
MTNRRNFSPDLNAYRLQKRRNPLVQIHGNNSRVDSQPSNECVYVGVMDTNREFHEGVTEFTTELYDKIIGKQGDNPENFLFSPMSIYAASLLVMAGADGETLRELQRLLRIPDRLCPDDVHSAFGPMILNYFKGSAEMDLALANRLFLLRPIEILPDYTNQVEACYESSVELVSLFIVDPEAQRYHMNTWVSKNTKDKIKELLPCGSVDNNTVLAIINALYFRGTWVKPFDKMATCESDFYCLNGEIMKVQMMFKKTYFPVASFKELDCVGIKLPFQSNGPGYYFTYPDYQKDSLFEKQHLIVADCKHKTMRQDIPVCPKGEHRLTRVFLLNCTCDVMNVDVFTTLEISFACQFELQMGHLRAPSKIASVLSETFVEQEVHLNLPKFKFSEGEPLDVKEVFENCGVKQLFGAGADLSKLSKFKIFVSDALHKSILEVDEEGATAAAATYFRMAKSASFNFVKMRVEHPFVVALICDSKLPAFIGHVVKPEYKIITSYCKNATCDSSDMQYRNLDTLLASSYKPKQPATGTIVVVVYFIIGHILLATWVENLEGIFEKPSNRKSTRMTSEKVHEIIRRTVNEFLSDFHDELNGAEVTRPWDELNQSAPRIYSCREADLVPTAIGNTPYWFKDEDLARIVANDLIIKEDFITTEEEQNLSTELDTVLAGVAHRWFRGPVITTIIVSCKNRVLAATVSFTDDLGRGQYDFASRPLHNTISSSTATRYSSCCSPLTFLLSKSPGVVLIAEDFIARVGRFSSLETRFGDVFTLNAKRNDNGRVRFADSGLTPLVVPQSHMMLSCAYPNAVQGCKHSILDRLFQGHKHLRIIFHSIHFSTTTFATDSLPFTRPLLFISLISIDQAITDFRETERKTWRTINRPVIERLQNLTAATEFPKPATDLPIDQVVLPYIHVLDLAESGEIKAHIDSVRFCGGSVVVLSLLSDSVLRLAVAPSKEVVALPADQPGLAELSLPNPGSYVDLRIPRRSVYVMRGASRYLLTHAILSNTDVARLFAEHGSRLYDIQRPRRISVICRISPLSRLHPPSLPTADSSTRRPAPTDHADRVSRSRSRSPLVASIVHLASRPNDPTSLEHGVGDETRRVLVRAEGRDVSPENWRRERREKRLEEGKSKRKSTHPSESRSSRHASSSTINRKETCPILIRLSYSTNGKHHSLSKYDRGRFPENELQINTWIDCSLRELAEEVRDACPMARKRGTRLHFAAIYPDQHGTYRRRELGVVISGFISPVDPTENPPDASNNVKRPFHLADDSSRTLLSKRFHIGDFIDVAIAEHVPGTLGGWNSNRRPLGPTPLSSKLTNRMSELDLVINHPSLNYFSWGYCVRAYRFSYFSCFTTIDMVTCCYDIRDIAIHVYTYYYMYYSVVWKHQKREIQLGSSCYDIRDIAIHVYTYYYMYYSVVWKHQKREIQLGSSVDWLHIQGKICTEIAKSPHTVTNTVRLLLGTGSVFQLNDLYTVISWISYQLKQQMAFVQHIQLKNSINEKSSRVSSSKQFGVQMSVRISYNLVSTRLTGGNLRDCAYLTDFIRNMKSQPKLRGRYHSIFRTRFQHLLLCFAEKFHFGPIKPSRTRVLSRTESNFFHELGTSDDEHSTHSQRCRTDTSEFLTVTGLQLNRNTTLTPLDTCTPTGSFVSELFLDETLLSNYPQIYKIGRCAFIFAKMKKDHHLPEGNIHVENYAEWKPERDESSQLTHSPTQPRTDDVTSIGDETFAIQLPSSANRPTINQK